MVLGTQKVASDHSPLISACHYHPLTNGLIKTQVYIRVNAKIKKAELEAVQVCGE